VRLAVLGVLACELFGCAELGVVSDGTSISVGKPNNGYLIDGARLPDHGDGFTTRDVWITRNNRYGTDEVIDLVTSVARRMHAKIKDVKIVVADLSARGGGGSFEFHRSHQSGRDVDFLYYMRDEQGHPFEADAMHVFDGSGRARDGTGITMDVARTWLLVKELLTAREATVQYIFLYEPLCKLLLDHAKQINEPPELLAKARRALRQPGDSARHDDHMHVRVYCSPEDRAYGCVDIGPMDLLAEREAEDAAERATIAAATPAPSTTANVPWNGLATASSEATGSGLAAVRSLLSTRADRLDLRRWR
jgi:penicillin-insensitive murein DD-endopeptidase